MLSHIDPLDHRPGVVGGKVNHPPHLVVEHGKLGIIRRVVLDLNEKVVKVRICIGCTECASGGSMTCKILAISKLFVSKDRKRLMAH